MTPEGRDNERSGKPALSPMALSLATAAMLLTKAGATPVTEEMLRGDVEAGAPLNPDGTLNLVSYAAWLVKEMASGD